MTLAAGELLFGYHMPNQTFPGVPSEGLFERIGGELAERLAVHVDLGFRGFTLRNVGLRDPEAIAGAGELINLMRGRVRAPLAQA
jgi:hypothetical protein